MRIKTESFFLLILFFAACGKTEKATEYRRPYFDISGFFASEVKKLEAKNPAVEKTVTQNKSGESKTLNDVDWKTELSLFFESDINKPSWKDLYSTVKSPQSLEYLAKDKELRTRKIRIDYTAGTKVKAISITNRVNNLLYSSEEELVYFPDSAYHIIKDQKVILLGQDSFSINGRIIPPDTSNN